MTSLAALTSRVVSVADLRGDEITAMYHLFDEIFVASEAVFERDLAGKDWVILLYERETQTIQGFTTLALYEATVLDRRLSVVYSGDTLIRPAYRGTPELSRSWIKTVLALSAGMPQPLYWLLLTSGYRTYRFLPLFFAEFHPRHDRPTPPEIQALLDRLAADRFGGDFHRAEGIVRFSHGATPLKPAATDVATTAATGTTEIAASRRGDPHIAFFLAKNPGHRAGDELVSLTRIHPDNLTAAGRRMVR